MKMLLTLCLLLVVIGIADSTSLLGQSKKDGLFSFLHPKKKTKEFLKPDSPQVQSQRTEQGVDFRKECEDDVIVPGYVVGKYFLLGNSTKNYHMSFLSYGFDTSLGTILFNPRSAIWRPDLFSVSH